MNILIRERGGNPLQALATVIRTKAKHMSLEEIPGRLVSRLMISQETASIFDIQKQLLREQVVFIKQIFMIRKFLCAT